MAYAFPVIKYVPTIYRETKVSGEAKNWKSAIDSLYKNSTCELVKLPKEKKAMKCKWVFVKKKNPLSQDNMRY